MNVKLSALILMSVLCSCKTTKKIEQAKTDIKIEQVKDSETIVKTETVTDDLKEVIVEKTTVRNEIVKDNTGRSIFSPVTVSEKKTERYNIKKTEVMQDSNKESESIEISKEDTVSFNRKTEGMEVVKDLTKGISEGIFGNTVQYVIIAMSFILLIFLIRKMTKQKGDSH